MSSKEHIPFDMQGAIKAAIESDTPFETFLLRIEIYHDRPVNTMRALKIKTNPKDKALIWEQFCQLYLQKIVMITDKERDRLDDEIISQYNGHVNRYVNVWLWKEIPKEVKRELDLPRKEDNGIDIVAKTIFGTYDAIQCKYRKRTITRVSYKDLATFKLICDESGPWSRTIFMTNCRGISKKSKNKEMKKEKNKKKEKKSNRWLKRIINNDSFESMEVVDWQRMSDKHIEHSGYRLNASSSSSSSSDKHRNDSDDEDNDNSSDADDDESSNSKEDKTAQPAKTIDNVRSSQEQLRLARIRNFSLF